MSNAFVYINSRTCDKLEGSEKAISTTYFTTTPIGDEYKSLIKYHVIPIKYQCCVLYTNLIVIIAIDYDVIDWLVLAVNIPCNIRLSKEALTLHATEGKAFQNPRDIS